MDITCNLNKYIFYKVYSPHCSLLPWGSKSSGTFFCRNPWKTIGKVGKNVLLLFEPHGTEYPSLHTEHNAVDWFLPGAHNISSSSIKSHDTELWQQWPLGHNEHISYSDSIIFIQ